LFQLCTELYGEISLGLLDELRSRGFASVFMDSSTTVSFSFPGADLTAARPGSMHTFQSGKARVSHHPLLLRNLDWMTSLNIKYSMSTLTRTLLSPSLMAQVTIFPFWVSANRNSQPVIRNQKLVACNSEPGTRNLKLATTLQHGFGRTSYTLPQDFTLFVILAGEDHTTFGRGNWTGLLAKAVWLC